MTTFSGELCTVGDMDPDEVLAAGTTGFQIQREGLPCISVVGLTRDEVRAGVSGGLFLNEVRLILELGSTS